MLKKASLGMALMDALPVIFFAAAMYFVSVLFPSVLFIAGAALVMTAGAGKVLWKLILAVAGKNYRILNRQLRVVMPAGAVLILLSLFVDRGMISPDGIREQVLAFPARGFFLWAAIGMCLMGVCAKKLDASKASSHWIEQFINLTAQAALFLGVVLCWTDVTAYKTEPSALAYLPQEISGLRAGRLSLAGMKNTGSVNISKSENGLFFDGPGEKEAMIFYPGGRVEYTAYTKLMMEFALRGIDCFLVDMPYNLAIFSPEEAEKIREDQRYSYEKWYMGGHSLGGVMASLYLKNNHNAYNGLVLLAAYSSVRIEIPEEEEPFPVISVYGSEDKVLNMEDMEKSRARMPKHYTEEVIEGGCHAGFGSYGPQRGDGEPEISSDEQIRKTVRICIDALRGTASGN